MNKPETALMTVLWGSILSRVNAVSKKLQREDANLQLVVDLYESLISYTASLRNDFCIVIEEAQKLSGNTFNETISRKRKRMRFSDESDDDIEEESPPQREQHFQTNVFYRIVDRLNLELNERKRAYDKVSDNFTVLFKFREQKIPKRKSFPISTVCANGSEKLVYSTFFPTLILLSVSIHRWPWATARQNDLSFAWQISKTTWGRGWRIEDSATWQF